MRLSRPRHDGDGGPIGKLIIAVAFYFWPSDFVDGVGFTPARPAPDGEGWTLPAVGIERLAVHPSYVLDDGVLGVLDAWLAWRRGGVLPDPGGYAQQPARMAEAFRILDRVVAILAAERRIPLARLGLGGTGIPAG